MTEPSIERRIPKILSVIWIGPHDPPMNLIDTWEKKNINGWRFVLYRSHEGFEHQEQINARMRIREFNGAADIMRWEILAKTGGVVVDADSECLKALDEGPLDLLSNEFFTTYENEICRPGMLACGLMGAAPGSRVAAACHEACRTAPFEQAWKAVGPMLLTRIAKGFPEDACTIYPARVAIPVHFDKDTKAPGDAPIYAHQYYGSTRGYNRVRKTGCTCRECASSMIYCPWG